MDLDNFIIGKTKERRGKIWQKKSHSCLANIEQQLMAKIGKKTASASCYKKQKINGAQDQSELSEFPKESKHHGVKTEMIKPNTYSSNSPFYFHHDSC